MWYAINWLCAFYMTLFFQINNGIWYGGNYINSCLKPKEESEEFKRVIQTGGNFLQSYGDLFRPIFRHQHSTLIRYPLVQQSDKMDFNYYNKHLTARENKFEHFYPKKIGMGKKHESYYSSNFLLPNYKVLINPFVSRINVPSKIGGNQYLIKTSGETLSRRKSFDSEMKFKEPIESQCYNFGVKKRKHVNEKKDGENNKLIYLRNPSGGLFLPSKIVLDNFSSWKWKNKKEIQSNNLSMSMVYDLLLPKSSTHKLEKEINSSWCRTTKKRKFDICEKSYGYQYMSQDKKITAASSTSTNTESLVHLNRRTQLNACIHQEETTDECCEDGIDNSAKRGKHRKLDCSGNKIGKNVSPKCYIDCGCRTRYDDLIPYNSLGSLSITTEVPIIFKFEDYLCECYSTASVSQIPTNQRKTNGIKSTRKNNYINEDITFLRSNAPKTNLEIYKNRNDLQKCKELLTNPNDEINITKFIIISDDGVMVPENYDSFTYDFENVSSLDTDSFNSKEISTKIPRIKRRTFRCKSKWDLNRKRPFVPINQYHNYVFKKPCTSIASSHDIHLKNRGLRIRKVMRNKNRRSERKQYSIVPKDLIWKICKQQEKIKTNSKLIGDSVNNKNNKGHKKREFIGESQSINSTDPCFYLDQISAFLRTSTSSIGLVTSTLSVTNTGKPSSSSIITTNIENSSPSTFVTSNDEKPSTSSIATSVRSSSPTFITSITENSSFFKKTAPFISKTTRVSSSTKTKHHPFHIFERSTETITTEVSTDSGPKFKPDTGNRHPAKLKCEQQFNRECMCSITKFLGEINNLIFNTQDRKSLLDQLTNYECTTYDPVEASFKISPELKPRLISKKHKELLADEKNGPKEIIDETFQELLNRDIPNEETDFYVFASSNVEIPCFINNDVQLSPNTADSASYVWRQGDNKIITGGRVTEDLNHRGMLQIAEATIADSNNYTCTVNYTNPDTGQTVSDTFVHTVMVVTLPKFALHTLMHYTAKVKCDQEILEMFELYLPQQIEEYICYIQPERTKICTVEIHNPICHPKNNENIGLKSVWKFSNKGIKQNAVASQENTLSTMELSQNFQLDVADVTQTMISAANHTRCGPFCQLKIILKVVDILRESFTIVLPHPVTTSAAATFEPDINSMNMKILIACEGGYKLIQGFCMPCPAHSYSEEGSTECSKCPSGTHQPNIGSRTCIACPHPFRSGCSSLWLSPPVVAITILIVLLIVLISTIMVYFCKFCIAKCVTSRTVGLFKKKKRILVKEMHPRKTLKKKRRKSSPHLKMEDTTEPPSPPTEDFTS